ncbi:acid-sensing ion channel 2-like [Lingula anatina]|uniref:Acid-sensing ion channel 2-like n=1 Tax=Lingula anatina TaxID=7574 RepID=A0A1S3JGC5_LINAN|nr:acid-sensing ion channel 2-like [Lingula anatina]|eukprot:XP_013409196.1 acid-sensing ion channel 2-like [Lingula anatina]
MDNPVRTDKEDAFALKEKANTGRNSPVTGRTTRRRYPCRCAESTVNDFALSVNCQGLPQMFGANSGIVRRVVWFILISGGLALAIFQIVDRIEFFLSKPVAIQSDVVCPTSALFPTVTICNFNAIRLSRAESLHVKGLVEDVYPLSRTISPNFTGYSFARYDWKSFFESVAHEASAIKVCIWQGTKCTEQNFTTTFTDMGVCYSFNTGDGAALLRSDSSGSQYGLSLTMDAMQHEYFRGFAGIGAGYKVMVHDPREPPLMANLGFSVGVGMHTLAALKMYNISNLDTENWGKCRRNMTLKYYDYYSHSACRLECLTDFIINKCKCQFINMRAPNVPICDPKQIFDCYEPNRNVFIKEKGQCQQECPIPCDSITYDVSLSQAPLSDYHTGTFTVNNVKPDYIKNNFVQLDIFFQGISYERLEQYPAYNPFALGCDVGGAMGLVLGASALTLCEIMDFVIVWALRGKGKRLC